MFARNVRSISTLFPHPYISQQSSNILFYTSCSERLLSNKLQPIRRLSSLNTYDDIHRRSLENPEEFWDGVAREIEWMKPYDSVLDNTKPPFTRWFSGGELNVSSNALDRHVNSGKGDQLALIYDSPITGTKGTLTYKQLMERVSRLAGLLASLGVKKKDVVVLYMPMVMDTVVAMLATARLGAVHNVVFGGFAAAQLATRIEHSHAKVVMCTSAGIEPSHIVPYKPIVDAAIEQSPHKPAHCIVLQRPDLMVASLQKGRDIDWAESEARARPHDAVPVGANDPAYILYTSGTTGAPKGIVRPTGGHAVVLKWTMRSLYDLSDGDVWWAASDFGWVVGHSYICYAPLLAGCTSVVYEGKPVGTPDADQFFRVISEHGVRALFVAPTALRVISRELPSLIDRLVDTAFRYLFVAGEPLDHETRLWAARAFGSPVLDHWWQTETGFAISAHCMGLGMARDPPRGTTGKPFPGFDLLVLGEDGSEVPPGVLGRLVSRLPLPPGTFSTLLNADERFHDTYFTRYPGFYDTMDAGTRDAAGYISVRARDDDVINVAGHRLSTTALEEAMLTHPGVSEAAVIGVPDPIKGQVPVGLFVPRSDDADVTALAAEVVAAVRAHMGPVAAFRTCGAVAALPKTRSGKTPRKSFADIARGGDEPIAIPPTIDDPATYEHVVNALRKCGYAKGVSFPFK